MTQISGLFNASGEKWLTSKRFTMKNLKDLGLGKSSLETAVEFEAKALVDDYKKYVGRPTELPISLSVAILNVIWKMISGEGTFLLHVTNNQRYLLDWSMDCLITCSITLFAKRLHMHCTLFVHLFC